MTQANVVPLDRTSTLPIVPTETTTEVLVSIIGAEHSAAMEAGLALMNHWIRMGEALLLAKDRVQKGDWMIWLEDNYPGHFTEAFMAIRFARNAQEIRQRQITTKKDAIELVRSLDAERRVTEKEPNPQAQALADQGLSHTAIARRMGVNRATVTRWLNPKRTARERKVQHDRAKAARLALRKFEREAQRKAVAKRVRGDGTPLSEAYANVRKAVQMLEFARTAYSAEASSILSLQDKLYEVEDALGQMLREGVRG